MSSIPASNRVVGDRPGRIDSALDTIWYSRCPAPTASTIAIEGGWLARRLAPLGVTARRLEPSATVGANAHFDHRVVGLFRDGGNIPPIWARANGQETRVIAINWVAEYQVIAVRPGFDVEAAGGLAACRLALPVEDGSRVDFHRAMSLRGWRAALALTGAGDAPSAGRFVEIHGEQSNYRGGIGLDHFHDPEVQALRDGLVDAAYLKGAVGLDVLRRHGLDVALDIGAHPDRFVAINSGTPRLVTVDLALLEHRPELAVEYLAASIEAAEWAKENEPAVLEIGARVAYASIDGVRDGYGPDSHRRLIPELPPETVPALENQKDFLLREGFIAQDFDVGAWVEPRILEAAFARLSAEKAR